MILPSTSHNTKSQDAGFVRKVFLWFLLLAVIVFALPQYTLGLISRLLIVDEPPLPADAIVILLGAGTADRVIKADELFKKKLAPRIVFASGFVDRELLANTPQGFNWPAMSAPYLTALQSLGIPNSAIVEVPAQDAYDSAHELASIAVYAKKAGWLRVLLVSSAGHTRRVDLIWNRVGRGVEHITIAARPAELDRWWADGRTIRTVGYEFGALTKEFFLQLKSLVLG